MATEITNLKLRGEWVIGNWEWGIGNRKERKRDRSYHFNEYWNSLIYAGYEFPSKVNSDQLLIGHCSLNTFNWGARIRT